MKISKHSQENRHWWSFLAKLWVQIIKNESNVSSEKSRSHFSMCQLFYDSGPYHIETSSKSMEWFLYDRYLRYERVKAQQSGMKHFKLSFSFSRNTFKILGTNKPAKIYLFKVNNRNTRKKCEKCTMLTIKIPERRHLRHWRRSGVFSVNVELISHLLLALNK